MTINKLIQESDVIIDGIFGTGLNRDLNDHLKKLIYWVVMGVLDISFNQTELMVMFLVWRENMV